MGGACWGLFVPFLKPFQHLVFTEAARRTHVVLKLLLLSKVLSVALWMSVMDCFARLGSFISHQAEARTDISQGVPYAKTPEPVFNASQLRGRPGRTSLKLSLLSLCYF